MDPFQVLLTEDASVIMLLTIFIALFFTKRIVPWWMYEEVVDKLKKYEEAAPGLVERVDRLSETIDSWYDEQYEEHYVSPPPRNSSQNDNRPRRRRSTTYPKRRGISREEQ